MESGTPMIHSRHELQGEILAIQKGEELSQGALCRVLFCLAVTKSDRFRTLVWLLSLGVPLKRSAASQSAHWAVWGLSPGLGALGSWALG